ncbi:MAG: hypothetical protein ACPIOQ_60620, partial [Promethearchaeia archaeon]
MASWARIIEIGFGGRGRRFRWFDWQRNRMVEVRKQAKRPRDGRASAPECCAALRMQQQRGQSLGYCWRRKLQHDSQNTIHSFRRR